MHWTVKGFVHNQKEKAFVKEVTPTTSHQK